MVEKKHSGSYPARTDELPDLPHWPGDWFFGQNTEVGNPTSQVGWRGLGRLEASMPGRFAETLDSGPQDNWIFFTVVPPQDHWILFHSCRLRQPRHFFLRIPTLAQAPMPRRAGWRLWVLNTAASILILKILSACPFASPLAGACEKHQECSAMTRVRRPAKKCPHGRRRHRCLDCGGASVCEHGLRRERCRDCGGTSVCERDQCCECGGTSVCKHGRRRQQCRDCGNFVCEIQGCPRQDLPFAGAPSFEYQHYLPFRGCGLESGTAHAFVDFALPTPWGYVLLEVDEEQHKAYNPSCDARKDFDMAASVALGSGHKLLVLRYNPDAFKIAGMTRRTTKKERHAQLICLLGELLAREPEAPFTRLFLFYDRAAENNALPCVAEHWSEPVSRCA